MIRYRGKAVIVEKPRVSHLGRIFRAPCRKNYAVDQKEMIAVFLMASTCSITVQSLGIIGQRVRLWLRKYGVFTGRIARSARYRY